MAFQGPLHDELDPIKKVKFRYVLLCLWKKVFLLHVSTSIWNLEFYNLTKKLVLNFRSLLLNVSQATNYLIYLYSCVALLLSVNFKTKNPSTLLGVSKLLLLAKRHVTTWGKAALNYEVLVIMELYLYEGVYQSIIQTVGWSVDWSEITNNSF